MQVLQVMVHCALLNVPATGLTVLLFLARNCVISDMTVSSVGSVVMLNIFFASDGGDACVRSCFQKLDL